MRSPIKRITVTLASILLAILVSACSKPSQEIFDSPDAAIQALAGLIGHGNVEQVEQVFGPGSADMFRSGDKEADREDYDRVKRMIEERVEFEDFDENTRIALLGEDAWPWPIPLVREGEGWRFDSEKGDEELQNRRVGRNELWTLAALHELVEMQREYHSEPRDGKRPAYARKFRSSEGKHDGLFWPVEDGSELSPAGEVLADSESWENEPRPFHGYFYRILTSRGEDAPGGALNYLDEDGLMTRGFAAIAWPSMYGNSGVMTFVVGSHGLVFQKDLGLKTDELVKQINNYNPDLSWVPTDDSMLMTLEDLNDNPGSR